MIELGRLIALSDDTDKKQIHHYLLDCLSDCLSVYLSVSHCKSPIERLYIWRSAIRRRASLHLKPLSGFFFFNACINLESTTTDVTLAKITAKAHDDGHTDRLIT